MTEKAKGTFLGVCATIANKTGIDVFLIRLLAIILLLLSGGTFSLFYFLLGIFACEND